MVLIETFANQPGSYFCYKFTLSTYIVSLQWVLSAILQGNSDVCFKLDLIVLNKSDNLLQFVGGPCNHFWAWIDLSSPSVTQPWHLTGQVRGSWAEQNFFQKTMKDFTAKTLAKVLRPQRCHT